MAAQKLDFLLILDFEATCAQGKQPEPQEIIEFPCFKLNSRTLEVESQFHAYVKPEVHPVLSPFCTELTGIVQQMVADQKNLLETLKSFEGFLEKEDLLKDGDLKGNAAFVTCGDWDLNVALPRQLSFLNVPVPLYFGRWINLKKIFFKATRTFPKGMMHMLELLNIPHQGRHHSGIDDVKNITEVVKALIRRGTLFDITTTRAEAK